MTPSPTASTHVEPQTGDIAAVLIALQHLQTQIAFANDQLAKRIGVGSTDFLALVHLSVQGDTPPKKVGEALGLSSGAMTALADRLESAGLVNRSQHPTDRRSFVLRLTPAGVGIVEEAIPPMVEREHEMLSALTPAEQHMLHALLTKMVVASPAWREAPEPEEKRHEASDP